MTIDFFRKNTANVSCFLLLGVMPLCIMPGAIDAFYRIKLYSVATVLLLWVCSMFVFRGLERDCVQRFGPGGGSLHDSRFHHWEVNLLDTVPLVLFATVVISFIFSVNPSQSLFGYPYLPEGLFSWFFYLVVFYLFRHEVTWTEWVINLLLVCASLIALLGVLQFAGWVPYFGGGRLAEGMTTIGNRNFVGTYCTLLMPISVWYWMKKGKWGYLVSSALLFLLLLASLTRSAWVAFLVWFPLLMLLELRKKVGIIRLAWFIGFMVVTFIVVNRATGSIFISQIMRMLKDLQDITADDAGSSRMLIWKLSLPLLLDRPFTGYGIDTFADIFYTLPGVPTKFHNLRGLMKAHNELLQIGITMGFLTLTAYGVLVCTALYQGFSAIKRHMSEHPWRVPVLCAVVGYLVQANFNISVTVNAVLFWAFLGFLTSKPTQRVQ